MCFWGGRKKITKTNIEKSGLVVSAHMRPGCNSTFPMFSCSWAAVDIYALCTVGLFVYTQCVPTIFGFRQTPSAMMFRVCLCLLVSAWKCLTVDGINYRARASGGSAALPDPPATHLTHFARPRPGKIGLGGRGGVRGGGSTPGAECSLIYTVNRKPVHADTSKHEQTRNFLAEVF